MKKLLFIFSFLFVTAVPILAQEDTDDEGNEKVRDKMTEFIQRRLNLSKDEAEKFSPVFLRYFKEWRSTIRENRGDKLVLQQKIIELRLRYRPQFREIMGEQRGNQVYKEHDLFMKGLRDLHNDRIRNNPNRPIQRPRVVNRVL